MLNVRIAPSGRFYVQAWHSIWPFPHKQAGDFGTYNDKTGKLVIEGNIYTHDAIKEIASNYEAVHAEEVDSIKIESREMNALNVGANINAWVSLDLISPYHHQILRDDEE
jgi:hypothetical protein